VPDEDHEVGIRVRVLDEGHEVEDQVVVGLVEVVDDDGATAAEERRTGLDRQGSG
jgi:hypothetical protein